MELTFDSELLLEQIQTTSVLEWTAVAFGVSEVLLAKKNNVWLYPTGIIGILCGSILLLDSKLYAETLLHAYYLIMSIYGWANWKSRNQSGASRITTSDRKDLSITLAIVVFGWVFLYFMLTQFTDSDVPVVDAFVSSTAWAGMWLLAKRKLENWIWLNISNLVAIPLLYSKQLYMFSFLTLFLFVVAIFGYLEWRNELKNQHEQLRTI
jgi:nicotinamide mononucleotide transporter